MDNFPKTNKILKVLFVFMGYIQYILLQYDTFSIEEL